MYNIKAESKEKRNAFGVGFKSLFQTNTWRGIVKHKLLYLLILPAIVLVVIFSYAPMFGLGIAFQDYLPKDGVGGSEFIGFKTFYKILFDPMSASYLAFRNTIFISLIRIGTNFPVILIFTLQINELKGKRFKGIVQTISYIPFFISWIAVGGMSYNLFGVNDGILNKLVVMCGGEPITWYSENKYWWGILAISSLWKGMGWGTLIYLSALGSIDSELYDACMVDGGGRFRQIISVTLPGLMNVIMLQLILDIGSMMGDNVDQILAMTNSSDALNESTQVVGMIEFSAVTGGSQYSRATAYGLIRGIIGLILVLLANKVATKTENEGVL